MTSRQTPRQTQRPLPRIWLMTDPRFGTDLLLAIQRLPARSGVIFRHYDLAAKERRALFAQVRRVCMRRGHMLLLAGDERTALRWHAAGFHSGQDTRRSKVTIHSTPAHDRRELAKARGAGADLVLISPMFATASHPGARPLGRSTFMALAKRCGNLKVIALGGMNARNSAKLDKRVVHGWAAIDAFRR